MRAARSLFPLREPVTATAMSGRPAEQPFAYSRKLPSGANEWMHAAAAWLTEDPTRRLPLGVGGT